MSEKHESLTPTELELMNILWQAEEVTVREVMSQLPLERQLAYTSVSTILRIMERKGFISARKEGKTHHYYPLLTQLDYQQKTIKHVVTHVFGDAPSMLLQALVQSEQVDVAELKRLVSELQSKKKTS